MLKDFGLLAMLLLRVQPCWPLQRSTSTAWLFQSPPSQMAPLKDLW